MTAEESGAGRDIEYCSSDIERWQSYGWEILTHPDCPGLSVPFSPLLDGDQAQVPLDQSRSRDVARAYGT